MGDKEISTACVAEGKWRRKVMTNVKKLENDVRRLDRDELAAFRDWFREYDSDEWDREIEECALTGRLDRLAEEAIAEHKAGRTKEI
jgi:hypothetical protein